MIGHPAAVFTDELLDVHDGLFEPLPNVHAVTAEKQLLWADIELAGGCQQIATATAETLAIKERTVTVRTVSTMDKLRPVNKIQAGAHHPARPVVNYNTNSSLFASGSISLKHRRKHVGNGMLHSQVPADGELLFLFANAPRHYRDNSGSFYATVTYEEVMSQIQTGVVELKSASAPARKGKDTSSFTPVQFPEPFPEGSKVIVIPMAQTFNGPDTPGIRIADVTPKGFKIRINELVGSPDGKENQALSDGTHVSETIGWAAFTA